MNFEGKNAVKEALVGGVALEKIIISKTSNDRTLHELVSLAKEHHIKVQFAQNEWLDNESVTHKHQGVIAIGSSYDYCSVQDILTAAEQKNVPPFILILDEISDPHNFGSIIRSCECLGVSGIIIGKDRSCPVNETVIKVSAGAISYVKIAKVTNINREIESLKERNIWVYALELGGEELKKTNLTGAVALVVGSEGFGVSQLTKKLCDGVVTIPMMGQVNSLNASVAAGIALYEISQQRNQHV